MLKLIKYLVKISLHGNLNANDTKNRKAKLINK